MCKIWTLIVTVWALTFIALSLLLGKISVDIFSDEEFTDPLPDHFWGPKHLEKDRPNKTLLRGIIINVSDIILERLQSRLTQEVMIPRIVTQLEGTNFDYGFSQPLLNKFLEHWLTKYDWKKREELLNRFTHYKVEISGLDIHFQYVKSTRNPEYRKSKPLLLLHGFPSSFVEFQSLIPLLAEPADLFLNFELVMPSLPGYGFSSEPTRPGLGAVEMAQMLWKLMQRLGYKTFYAHGSDWGANIIAHMAVMYPDSVIAIHSSMCGSLHPKSILRMAAASLTPVVAGLLGFPEVNNTFSDFWNFTFRETGFYLAQATKPDTIGIALTNSPSGLAAYILEKLFVWNSFHNLDADEDIAGVFPVDALLDNIMVYWVTNTITSAMRLHSQSFSCDHNFNRIPVKVPTACLVPSGEPLFHSQTRQMKQDKYHNLTRYNELPSKGRFLGFERPQELANDIIYFVLDLELRNDQGWPALARKSQKEL